MVKINCCDICYKKDKKVTKAESYLHVKGKRELRLDYCLDCKKKIPKGMIEYVKFCYDLDKITLTDEQAKSMVKK